MPFFYLLQAVQTPACGFTATAWTISVTSGDNPSSVSSFATIVANSGVLATYSAGPVADISKVGTYVVQFTSVTLNGVAVTSFSGPSSFSLVVSNAC